MFWLGLIVGLSHPPHWWDCEAPTWLCMDCRVAAGQFVLFVVMSLLQWMRKKKNPDLT